MRTRHVVLTSALTAALASVTSVAAAQPPPPGIDPPGTVIPEPAVVALLATGLAAIALFKRGRKRR